MTSSRRKRHHNRRRKDRHNFSKEGPIYANIKVFDKEDRHVFNCSFRKAQWYIERSLCDILSEEPLRLRLNFQLNGTGHHGDDFYLQERESLCVVCGAKENLTLHHVVPISFRCYFPEALKSNSHHDVLPICLPDHHRYNTHEYQFRKVLEAEYDAPLDGVVHTQTRYSSKVVKFAYAIRYSGDEMPSARINQLFAELDQMLGHRVSMREIIHICDTKVRQCAWSQGEIIFWQLTDIQTFIRRWRQHFVDTMAPKFLPPHWSIDRTGR
jgi:exonuclease 3'-5' domain-containing protein 2